MIIRRASTLATTILIILSAASCSGNSNETESPITRNPLLRPSDYTETAPAVFQVQLETSAGDLTLEIHREWAPLGADRFYNLVNSGYYNETRIYRVIPGFMAQFGLNGDPYINQAWKSQFIVDDPLVESNVRGRVAFAMSGVHSRTTQVFISYGDNSELDEEGFTPIGEVIDGMDVADSFYADYGDGPPRGNGPYQAMAEARGNEYLDADFPELTRIQRASVVPLN